MSRAGFCSFLVLVAPIVANSQERPSFQAEAKLVNITASVRSTSGQIIGDLTQDDFEILDDGVPQTIRFFAREAELPLSLGLIIDASGSQDRFIKQHDRDVAKFLETALRPKDDVFAVCFGNHLRLVSDGDTSASSIIDHLKIFDKDPKRFPEIGPHEDRDLGTALYDAVYYSVQEKLAKPGQRRRAILLFSDGEENSSANDLLDTIEAAQNADTLVYSIRYTQMEHGRLNARNRYGIHVMHHLATLTGGGDFDALHTNLAVVFDQIAAELRSLYEIGYVPSNSHPDGTFHKVEIHCKRPDAVIRSRSGYYAR
ncbi:MAG: VWA domain-containing protein [Bryobacteraceae bacterium]